MWWDFVLLIPDKIDVKSRNIIKYEVEYFIMIKSRPTKTYSNYKFLFTW